MDITDRIGKANWQNITASLSEKGYGLAPEILTQEECSRLIAQYDDASLYRKTITMEHHKYGRGEYKYFRYPLPGIVQDLREAIYPQLAPVANNWMNVLNIEKQFPATLDGLLEYCHTNGQNRPTPLILKYAKGGYNALHQDLYGDIYFPMQAVLFLSKPGEDYAGGEFVLIEQQPRAQSKAIVLTPGQGDMLVFTTNFRPAKGAKGYHRVNMRHGVSELTDGNRYTLGIIFHDAA
jgi:hypothetical protein